MKSEQVKELVANWRERSKVKLNPSHINFDIYDGQRQAFANCADELEAALEQAEREAVGQGDEECKCSRGLDGILDTSRCPRHKFIVHPDGHAAPRPEASRREAIAQQVYDGLWGRALADEDAEDEIKSIICAALAAQPEQP